MNLRYVLLLGLFCVGMVTVAQKPTDTELWLGGAFKLKLNKQLRFDVKEQFRFNDTISSLKSSFTEFGLKYRINKHFSLKGNVRFIARPTKNNRNRFSIDGYYNWKKKGSPWSLQYRLRFQNTSEVNSTQKFAYARHKISIDYNASKLVDPFVSYEVYCRLNRKNEFRVTRLTLGLDWRLLKGLNLTTYYRIQNDINIKKPEKQNIFGLMLSYGMNMKKKKKE